jgi:hypothetical protein
LRDTGFEAASPPDLSTHFSQMMLTGIRTSRHARASENLTVNKMAMAVGKKKYDRKQFVIHASGLWRSICYGSGVARASALANVTSRAGKCRNPTAIRRYRMRAMKNISFPMRKLALAAALATSCTQAGAVLVADGKLDGANGSVEGYQLGFSIGMLDTLGNSLGNAKLYFGQDAGGQFLYFQLPLGFVDNTYGNNANWTHSFNNLLIDDAQSIGWGGSGANTNRVAIDYLAGCVVNSGLSKDNAANCGAGGVSGYRSAGVGTSGTGGAGSGSGWSENDGSVNAGSAANLLNIATSLEHNLNVVDPTATTNSSLNANWIKEVGYEIQFKPGTFNAADWVNKDKAPGLISLYDPTSVYPSKKTFKDYTAPNCTYGCTTVPEPGTTWLLGIGLLGMVWYARRRLETPVRDPLKVLMPS